MLVRGQTSSPAARSRPLIVGSPGMDTAHVSPRTTRDPSLGGLCRTARSLRVAAFGVARQSAVGDRFLRGGVRNELADAWANAGVVGERPHPYRYRIGVTWIETEERRPALATEPLLVAGEAQTGPPIEAESLANG